MISSAIPLVLLENIKVLSISTWPHNMDFESVYGRVRAPRRVTVTDTSIIEDKERIFLVSTEMVDLVEPSEARGIQAGRVELVGCQHLDVSLSRGRQHGIPHNKHNLLGPSPMLF